MAQETQIGPTELISQEPWTRDDSNRYGGFYDIVKVLHKAASPAWAKEEVSSDEISRNLAEFDLNTDVLARGMAKWAQGETGIFAISLPPVILVDYIRATAVIGEREGDSKKYLGTVVPLVGQYVDALGQTISKKIEVDSGDEWPFEIAARALSLYVGYGENEEQKTKAVGYLENALDFFDAKMTPSDKNMVRGLEYFIPLLQIHKFGSSEARQKTEDLMLRTATTHSASRVHAFFDPTDFSHQPFMDDLMADYIGIVERKLESYGLNAKALTRGWIAPDNANEQQLYNSKHQFIRGADTLSEVKDLEEIRPGSARVLQEQFGINHFARYPIEVLVRQFDERDDLSKPYGILWGPDDDNTEPGTIRGGLTELLNTAGDQVSIRVTECDSKYGQGGIGRRLYDFDNRYNPNGQGHKINFLIPYAHGNEEGDRMWFGHKRPFHTVSSKDFERGRVQNISDYLIENPDIVFVVCDLGKSLAQQASKALHARVFAYDNAINTVFEFRPELRDGKVYFDPQYKHVEEGNRVLFVDGEQKE